MQSKRVVQEIDGQKYLLCNNCGKILPATKEYWTKDKKCLLGFSSQCKKCLSIKKKEYYYKDIEKSRIKAKCKYKKNKEYVLNWMKDYYKNNRDKILESHKKWRENNKDKMHIYILNHREYYHNRYKSQAEKWKEYGRIYRQKHKEELNEKIKKKKRESGHGAIHLKTERKIKKIGINIERCMMCGKTGKIEAHHPDYSKWNEVVFLCKECHQRIHYGWFECPQDKIIDLLNFNS